MLLFFVEFELWNILNNLPQKTVYLGIYRSKHQIEVVKCLQVSDLRVTIFQYLFVQFMSFAIL